MQWRPEVSPGRRRVRRRVPDHDIALMHLLRREGRTFAEIGRLLGWHEDTVYGWIHPERYTVLMHKRCEPSARDLAARRPLPWEDENGDPSVR